MDIVDKLNIRKVAENSANYVEMDEAVLDEAIAEIRRLRASMESLRAIAGAIDARPSFLDIKQSIPIPTK